MKKYILLYFIIISIIIIIQFKNYKLENFRLHKTLTVKDVIYDKTNLFIVRKEFKDFDEINNYHFDHKVQKIIINGYPFILILNGVLTDHFGVFQIDDQIIYEFSSNLNWNNHNIIKDNVNYVSFVDKQSQKKCIHLRYLHDQTFYHFMIEGIVRSTEIFKIKGYEKEYFMPPISDTYKRYLEPYNIDSNNIFNDINERKIIYPFILIPYHYPKEWSNCIEKFNEVYNLKNNTWIVNFRVSGRKCLNMDKLFEALELKYKNIKWLKVNHDYLKKLSLYELIHIFNNSNGFISCHGADLSNAIFMRPNTHVINIIDRYQTGQVYGYLCKKKNINYHSTISFTRAVSANNNSDKIVDIDLFLKYIDEHVFKSHTQNNNAYELGSNNLLHFVL